MRRYMDEVILKVEGIHTSYGNIEAIRGISLDIAKGEIVCLIGSNGAGKTTTLNTISGILKPKRGKILFKGKRIDGIAAFKIAQMGISQVPEGRKIFSRLTVMENLEMGAFFRKDKNSIEKDLKGVFEIFPRLDERKDQVAGTLSGGEQQMLAIGRALMARPELLLLDEPSMGLAPILVELIFDTIEKINQRGTTMLLVEQNASMAFQIAHRGYVIQSGEIALHDSIAGLKEDDMVKRLYLGLE